jgi:hypothetical protein
MRKIIEILIKIEKKKGEKWIFPLKKTWLKNEDNPLSENCIYLDSLQVFFYVISQFFNLMVDILQREKKKRGTYEKREKKVNEWLSLITTIWEKKLKRVQIQIVCIFIKRLKNLFWMDDKGHIKHKLSPRKASLLSMAGRIQLVRFVIQSMMIYDIPLYSWVLACLLTQAIWKGYKELYLEWWLG